MKHFGLQGILFLALTFLLNACASKHEVSEQSSMQSTAPVPGEQVSGEGIAPGAGPGRAGANVRW